MAEIKLREAMRPTTRTTFFMSGAPGRGSIWLEILVSRSRFRDREFRNRTLKILGKIELVKIKAGIIQPVRRLEGEGDCKVISAEDNHNADHGEPSSSSRMPRP